MAVFRFRGPEDAGDIRAINFDSIALLAETFKSGKLYSFGSVQESFEFEGSGLRYINRDVTAGTIDAITFTVIKELGRVSYSFTGLDISAKTFFQYVDFRVSPIHLLLSGNDSLYGTIGSDTLFGYDGNDRLFADIGDDVLNGGQGNNRLFGGAGNDSLSTGRGVDSLFAGNGNNRLSAGVGNDRLFAGNGNDMLNAGGGNDRLVAGDGNDTLSGGAGNDTLAAGSDSNSLFGGRGSDDFIFDTSVADGANMNVIHDFSAADRIILNDASFPGLGAVGALGGRFHVGLEAAAANDRIIYDKVAGDLYFDPDGNGSEEQIRFIHLTLNFPLTQADFLVI